MNKEDRTRVPQQLQHVRRPEVCCALACRTRDVEVGPNYFACLPHLQGARQADRLQLALVHVQPNMNHHSCSGGSPGQSTLA